MFEHLKRYDVAREPVDYTLFQLDGEPKLRLLPGTEVNKPYHNALLKRNAKLAQRFRAGSKVTGAMLRENREHDQVLYAKHVIVGWEGILDDEGNPVAFTPAVCKEFLEALPDWIFDDVRQFAVNPVNFLGDDEPDAGDIEDAAGN